MVEASRIELFQRIEDRANDVGAAPDGLRQDYSWIDAFDELIRPGDEVVEPTTETPAGDLNGAQTGSAKRFGIDGILGLVISDDADAATFSD